jgi:MoaA/NifB/PqqE/SkfB family radical SAM enzyme
MRKTEMKEFMKHFIEMPDRLLKYNEILLKESGASSDCYQDTMSYRRLAIAITTVCNLSCAWCYRFDSHYTHTLDKEMPVETFEKIINNTKGRFRLIHMAGIGEPTMHKNLCELVKIARRITDKVKITTNGTLLTKEMLELLEKAGLTDIEISIDSFSTDELMELRGSNLSALVENMRFINDHTEMDLQINSVVSNLNYEGLMNIVDVLGEMDRLKVLHTIPLFKTEQFNGTVVDTITDEKYKFLLEKIENDIHKKELNWRLWPSSHGVTVDPVIEMKKKNNICFTAFDDPYIDVDGYFTTCGRREFSSMDDATKGFEEGWNGPKLLKYRANMLNGFYPKFCGSMCFLKEKEREALKSDEEKIKKDNSMRIVVDDLIKKGLDDMGTRLIQEKKDVEKK